MSLSCLLILIIKNVKGFDWLLSSVIERILSCIILHSLLNIVFYSTVPRYSSFKNVPSLCFARYEDFSNWYFSVRGCLPGFRILFCCSLILLSAGLPFSFQICWKLSVFQSSFHYVFLYCSTNILVFLQIEISYLSLNLKLWMLIPSLKTTQKCLEEAVGRTS